MTSEAPERIWAGTIETDFLRSTRVWGDDPKVGTDETPTEYVRADLAAPGWQPIGTAPRDQWILLGYTQQGDEMPTGLMVGVGMYCKSGKIWTMNAMDNEKAWPNHWMPLPKPPLNKEN